MLGYASSIDDLSLGDELKGKLYIGDLAYKDSNGVILYPVDFPICED